ADAAGRVEDEEHPGSWTRSWQLSTLVLVAADDREARALMELSTDRAREPNRWVRYWTLVTANERKGHHAWTLARATALAQDQGENLQLRCLAWALMASERDDRPALEALLWCLDGAPQPAPKDNPYLSQEPADPVHAHSSA